MKNGFHNEVYTYTNTHKRLANPQKVKFLDEIAYLSELSASPIGREKAVNLGEIVLKHLEQHWQAAIKEDIQHGWAMGAEEIYKIIS